MQQALNQQTTTNRERLESEFEELVWEDLIHKSRKSLIGFTISTKTNYEVNWHHTAVADILERVLSGELNRVIITMPPQNGKSELVSRRFPAFALGRRPDLKIIAGTYGQELASKNNTDIQNIMDTEFYRAVFPSTMIPGHHADDFEGKYKRTSREFSIVNNEGSYRCAGVGGPVTGFPADIILLDDLIKNREEADSYVMRQKVWDWMTSTARTRLNQNGAIIITMTRWHQDDPVGRIEEFMKSMPDFDRYSVFNFPALSEASTSNSYDKRPPNVALWPAHYNEAYLKSTKASSGSRDWNAIYQGSPVSAEGSIFKRSWFKFYRELPSGVTDHLQSWDLSFEDKATSSFTVGQAWCRFKADLYMIDQTRGLMDFPAQKQAVVSFSGKHPKVFTKIVEKKANGAALIAELQHDIPGLIPVEPHGSKLDRAKAASPAVEAGNVYLPHPDIAPWVHDLIDELCNFPTSKYNDQVDTFSQAILRYRVGNAAEFTRDLIPRSRGGTFANNNTQTRRVRSQW